ncbi:MAG: hypothetical protein AAFX94_15080, partial [Myxococcota bacterium]
MTIATPANSGPADLFNVAQAMNANSVRQRADQITERLQEETQRLKQHCAELSAETDRRKRTTLVHEFNTLAAQTLLDITKRPPATLQSIDGSSRLGEFLRVPESLQSRRMTARQQRSRRTLSDVQQSFRGKRIKL